MKKYECIINQKEICPNKVISGKMCHSCKLPNEYQDKKVIATLEEQIRQSQSWS